MSGRCTLAWLTLLAVLASDACSAQEAGPGGYFHPAAPGGWGDYCPPDGGAAQAGYFGGHGGRHHGMRYPATGPAVGPHAGNNYYEALPDDTGWLYEEGPLGRFLGDVFRHAWFRTEFLLMDISDPGRNYLAEPNTFVEDPFTLIPSYVENAEAPTFFIDPNTGNLVQGLIPILHRIKINENNGARGTMGLELKDGTFELGAWVLQSSNSAYDGNEWINTPDLVAEHVIFQPVLQEGASTGFPLVYDISYRAELKTGVWGAESNWMWRDPNPNDNFDLRPLVGVKYFNFKESLQQRGDYTFIDQFTGATEIVQRRIDSSTDNYLYGPQIGFRAALTSKWFDLGVTPKIMLGLNSYRATLFTANVLSPTEPIVSLRDTQTTFGPIADLQVDSRIKLHEHFHVVVGYNFMWAGMLTRPYQNVVYNTLIAPPQGVFSQEINYTDAIIQGLSVGGEFRF